VVFCSIHAIMLEAQARMRAVLADIRDTLTNRLNLCPALVLPGTGSFHEG
jgi:hypothetical protein